MAGRCCCNYKCGFMGMEEREGSNVFVKRYFRFNQVKGRLQYYLDQPRNVTQADAKPAGYFNMPYVSQVTDASNVKPSIKFCFSLTVQGKKHFFQTASEQEKNGWISVLKDAAKIRVSGDQNARKCSLETGSGDHGALIMPQSVDDDAYFPCDCSDSSSDESGQFVAAYHSQHKPVKVGYCTKQGAKRKNWKRRYFILNQETLSYFQNKEDKSPIRSIELSAIREVRLPYGQHPTREFLFEIVTENRTFYIQTDSEQERTQWIGCINQCLEQKNIIFQPEQSAGKPPFSSNHQHHEQEPLVTKL